MVVMGGGREQGIVVVETWLWESLKPSWLKGTLQASLPLRASLPLWAWDRGHDWDRSIQPSGLALPSAAGAHGERVSLQGFRGQRKSGHGRQMSLNLIISFALSSLGASRWPRPVPP